MRKQTKKIVLLGVVILLISISGYFFPQQKSVFRKPAIRKNASDYLTGAELLNLRESIQYYQHKIWMAPDGIANYTNLATLKMQQALLMGSHHENYAEVQQLLNKILSSQPQNFEAVLTQASLFMNYHKFEAHEKQGWNIDLEYAKFCLENVVNPGEVLQRISKELKRRPNHKAVAELYQLAMKRRDA